MKVKCKNCKWYDSYEPEKGGDCENITTTHYSVYPDDGDAHIYYAGGDPAVTLVVSPNFGCSLFEGK